MAEPPSKSPKSPKSSSSFPVAAAGGSEDPILKLLLPKGSSPNGLKSFAGGVGAITGGGGVGKSIPLNLGRPTSCYLK